MKKTTLVTATFLALGTALISGVSNFIAKISVTVVKDPIVFTTLKNALVAVALVGIIISFRKWNELRSLTRQHWFKLVAIGVIGGSVPFALFFTGLTHTTALNAGLIHKSLFFWVLLLAMPILKERMTRWQWLGLGVVAVSNVLIGGFKGFKFNIGELMILGATLLWAVENIVAKIALKDLSSTIVAAARMVLGSAVLVAFVVLRGGGSAVAHLNATQWNWTLLSSVLLVGYVLTWYAALKRAPATYVAVLLVPATMLTNVLTAVFITHTFPTVQLMQALAVTAGTFLLIRFTRKTVPVSAIPNAVSSGH